MKRPIWDYLFYLSMFIILLWVILKSVCIIKTPFWLEYGIPIATFVLGFITFFQSIESRISKIEIMLVHHDRDIERLKDSKISS